ncbi:MAG: methyltransferase domain-containing protein [Candidatus Hydrogenedentes bacterium]|nr:methyltransferase domain-containing protein [Candidatus Hydrogenedentota bacterium]
MSTLTFMKEVILANRSTGALAPSSKALAEMVTNSADVANARVIVEFGPGTGVFTKVIERKMRPDALFIALEVNPEFVKATRKSCRKVHVYHDGAQNTRKYLQQHGVEHCDTIISGLPWSRFSDELQDEILDATFDVLRPGGKFITFAYSASPLLPSGKKFFKGKLQRKFKRVTRSKQIWKNFPPSVVYVCQKG